MTEQHYRPRLTKSVACSSVARWNNHLQTLPGGPGNPITPSPAQLGAAGAQTLFSRHRHEWRTRQTRQREANKAQRLFWKYMSLWYAGCFLELYSLSQVNEVWSPILWFPTTLLFDSLSHDWRQICPPHRSNVGKMWSPDHHLWHTYNHAWPKYCYSKLFVKESPFLVMMMEIKRKHWCLRKIWFSFTKYKMDKTNDWNPKSYACLYPGIFSFWWDVAASVSLAFFFFLILKVMQMGAGTCRYSPTHIAYLKRIKSDSFTQYVHYPSLKISL